MEKKVRVFTVLICLLLLTTGCRREQTAAGYKEVEKTGFLMGTLVTLKVFDRDADKSSRAADKAFARIREIESLMSLNIEDSQVNNINEWAGIRPVEVSHDTLKVVEKGIYYGQLSEGLFDITVGPLARLWGIGTENPQIPGSTRINNALGLVDYRDVEINQETKEIFLKRPGMVIDLGGIAKGYAADEAKKVLMAEGIEHAIINLGGNVLTVGPKHDGGPWNIGIKDPYNPNGSLLGFVRIQDKTVVTSGDYERYFEKDGKRYHHILNPYTGFPGNNEIKGVTLIAHSSFDADALSTTVFLLGVEKGMQLVESLDGIEAVAITRDRQVVISSGMGDAFSISNNNYKMR